MKKISLLILIVLLVQCKKVKSPDKCDCEQTACTEIFVTLMTKVKDASGLPVRLDGYYTIHSSISDTIYLQTFDQYTDSVQKANGTYPVLDDNYPGSKEICSDNFEFVGFRDGKEIARKTYSIRINCCHVEWMEEYTDIIVAD